MKNFRAFSTRAYFGAANGFGGFRHSFDKIFSPEEFTKIFVLKGGPGTGKSSFMEKFASYFHGRAVIEAILCSSDSDSLDGIILEKGEKRFAILDGTSPHEMGLRIPGVKDEIINLCENWNDEILHEYEKEIIELNRKKATSYKRAYSALRVAGEAEAVLSDIAKSRFDDSAAAKNASIIISGEKSATKQNHGLLLRAFNKNGFEEIDFPSEKTLFRIGGQRKNAALFMKAVSFEFEKRGCDVTRYFSPLDPGDIDAIETKDMLFVISDGACDLKCDIFANEEAYPYTDTERAIKNAQSLAFSAATQAFSDAAGVHGEIEKIYKNAMDFNKNDRLLELIIERTEKILKN